MRNKQTTATAATAPPAKMPVVHEPADDTLIEHVLAGEESAYERLVVRYNSYVHSIARHFFRHAETVEDIAQETFTKAYFSLASYRRGASFKQWLARIAVNNCYDELRRRKRTGEMTIADVTEEESLWLETKLAPIAFERHFNAEERGRAAEITEKLLESLSPDDRLVLILLHAEEYSVREISEVTGWAEAKVKIRAFRARHAMRKAYNRLQLTEERKARALTKTESLEAEKVGSAVPKWRYKL